MDDWLGAPVALLGAAIAAMAGAFIVARLVARAGVLIDKPNDRSSHDRPTPRSGGVAIFAGWAAGMAVFAAASGAPEMLDPTVKLGLIASGVLLLGLVDDVYEPSAYFKLAGQILAGVVFVLVFGAPQTIPIPGVGAVALGDFAAPLSVFWIAAFMNAFNFMDGVNGLAAACGAFVLAALAVASAFLGAPFWAASTLLLALALLAFLPLNFPRAALFMGDNGSQTVGFLIAAAALGAARESGEAVSLLFAPVAILPFLFDVAFTLAGRTLRGRNILRAHREHIYQILIRFSAAHAHVTALYVSLTAISTAGAIFMLRLPPEAQWQVPAALIVLLGAPAALIVFNAARAGLFESEEAAAQLEGLPKKEPPVNAAPAAHAAE